MIIQCLCVVRQESWRNLWAPSQKWTTPLSAESRPTEQDVTNQTSTTIQSYTHILGVPIILSFSQTWWSLKGGERRYTNVLKILLPVCLISTDLWVNTNVEQHRADFQSNIILLVFVHNSRQKEAEVSKSLYICKSATHGCIYEYFLIINEQTCCFWMTF